MKKILVLAIGSPFIGDNASWELVEQIKASNLFNSGSEKHLTFEISDRPGLNLLNYLYAVDHAILIDTVIGANIPAAWYNEAEFCHLQKPISCHEIGLAETLKIGRELGGLPAVDLMGIWVTSAGRLNEKTRDLAIKLLAKRLSSCAESFKDRQ